MKINSTHKNLNTSYINLSALLRFLQQQNFVGSIHLEAKGYEADVFFTKADGLKVRENDHIAGRISVGNDVLAQILIRAHEPDGIINVYDEIEKETASGKSDDELETVLTEVEKAQTSTEDQVEPFELSFSETEKETESTEEIAPIKPVSLKEKLGLPNLPFSFRKKNAKKIPKEITEIPKVEIIESPKEEDFSPDWHELLDLIGEILQTVENSLAESNLNFVWVFDRVRENVFEEYPFLHPNSTVFEYKNGKVLMSEQINNNLFIASIAESLRLLLEKFETHPKFDEVRRSIVKNTIELMNKRHAQYDKFLITQQLEDII
jgi:hypothetical protein